MYIIYMFVFIYMCSICMYMYVYVCGSFSLRQYQIIETVFFVLFVIIKRGCSMSVVPVLGCVSVTVCVRV